MKFMPALAAALAFTVAPAALSGATQYTLIEKDTSGALGSLTNAVRWSINGKDTGAKSGNDGENLKLEHAYYVSSGNMVCTLSGSTAAQSLSFKGYSLSAGRIRHKSYGDAIVDWDDGGTGEGLILRNADGKAYYETYSPFNTAGSEAHVYGKVTVQSSNADPYPIILNQAVILNFHGAFCSTLGKTLHLQFNAAGTFKFSGSLSGYMGTVASAGAAPGTIAFGTTTCPGTVLATNAVTIAALASDDMFTVGTLALGAGAKIAVSATMDGAGTTLLTNSFIVVTNALVSMGKATVSVAGITPSNLDGIVRVPVLEVPAEADIYPDMFTMNAARFEVVTNDATGAKTLVAVVAPVVTQTASSSTIPSADWSDGQPPHSGAHYQVNAVNNADTTLYTANDANLDYEFPGESLYLASGKSVLRTRCKSTFLKELRLYPGAYVLQLGCSGTLRGRIVMPDSPNYASIGVYNSLTLTNAADIVGTGRLVMDGYHNSTSSRKGFNVLAGDNSRFFGTITVGLHRDPLTIADDKYQRLYVSDPSKLGAPLPAFNAKALVLKRLGRLVADGSVTLADATRGVFIGTDGGPGSGGETATKGTASEGQVYAGSGKTLTILTQLTMNGRLHKYGAGTLALGGPLKFGNAASDEPLASSNLLAVAQGYVKPLAADSFNGLEMTFAAGTGIKLDIDPQDADLRAYGLRNTKAVTPFTAVGGTIPVSFDVPDGFSTQSEFSVGIVTVPAESVESVRGMLSVARPKIGCSMSIDVVPHGDDATATIAATFKRVGLLIIFK